MSDILYNSYRFTGANSARIDQPGSNRGQITSDGRFGFDCSGFLYYVLTHSGYNIGDYLNTAAIITRAGTLTTAGANWQTTTSTAAMKPGDLVYFTGHVGIVVSYDASTQTGVFRSSTTSKGVVDALFTTNPNNTSRSIYWGENRTGKSFLAATSILQSKFVSANDKWATTGPQPAIPPLEQAPVLTGSNANQANNWLGIMATIESTGNPSETKIQTRNGVVTHALGLFQMTIEGGLAATGYTDGKNWLGKDGISSQSAFLNSPDIQRKAAAAYLDNLRTELKKPTADGTIAWNYIGQVVNNRLLTEGGMLAAAWFSGSNGFAKWLRDPSSSSFINIPTRLDMFRGTLAPGASMADTLGSAVTSDQYQYGTQPGSGQLYVSYGPHDTLVIHFANGKQVTVPGDNELYQLLVSSDHQSVTVVQTMDDGNTLTRVYNVNGAIKSHSLTNAQGSATDGVSVTIPSNSPIFSLAVDTVNFTTDKPRALGSGSGGWGLVDTGPGFNASVASPYIDNNGLSNTAVGDMTAGRVRPGAGDLSNTGNIINALRAAAAGGDQSTLEAQITFAAPLASSSSAHQQISSGSITFMGTVFYDAGGNALYITPDSGQNVSVQLFDGSTAVLDGSQDIILGSNAALVNGGWTAFGATVVPRLPAGVIIQTVNTAKADPYTDPVLDANSDGVNISTASGNAGLIAAASTQVSNTTPYAAGINRVSGSGQVALAAISPLGTQINLAGSGADEAIGGTGSDTLIGSDGNDWLIGGDGSDLVQGGAGNDVLVIDAQDQQAHIDGGAGIDTVIVAADEAVSLNLATANVEVVYGGTGNDIFVGGGADNYFIDGGAGDDFIVGGSADDVLSGGDGDDIIDGGAGNDLLRGGRGDDLLSGGDGDDVLDGGAGSDTVQGGAGNDVIVASGGRDEVDGGAGTDILQLAGTLADYTFVKNVDGSYTITDHKNADGSAVTAGQISDRNGVQHITNVEGFSFQPVGGALKTVTYFNSLVPLPVDDQVNVDPAASYSIAAASLLANDIDFPNQALSIKEVGGAEGGTVALSADRQTIVFTPKAGYLGQMGFTYRLQDAQGNDAPNIYDTADPSITGYMKGRVAIVPSNAPTDPDYAQQWYLGAIGAPSVWPRYTGNGVKVLVLGPPGEFAVAPEVANLNAPDLFANRAANFVDTTDHSDHATAVAAVIAAARNGIGGIGVAYGATIDSKSFGPGGTSVTEMDATMDGYDVVNNSFTPINNPWNVGNAGLWAFKNAAEHGRNNLGTVMVFAAGNDGAKGYDAGLSLLTANPYTIAVGAINRVTDIGTNGNNPLFGERGANILVSAPATNITTVGNQIQNADGSVFGSNTTVVQGTSYSAPIVSGVVALMLQANPKLSYRDVQTILAVTATKDFGPGTQTGTIWNNNGDTDWNGIGMHYSHDFGFGMVDARAAVRMAESWVSEGNDPVLAYQTITSTGSIPDRGKMIFNFDMTWRGNVTEDVNVEQVMVNLKLNHPRWSDLVVTLTSPSGTSSVLLDRPGVRDGTAYLDNPSGQVRFDNDLMSVHFRGEHSSGVWQLMVEDKADGMAGIDAPMSATLNVIGTKQNALRHVILTDEYSGKGFLGGVAGSTAELNAAAVTGDLLIDLSGGTESKLAGNSLHVVADSFQRLVGGDGADTLIGGKANETIIGGRGNDVIQGGTGSDVLDGGQGDDIYKFSLGDGRDTITDDVGSNQIVFGVGISSSMVTQTSVSADQVTLSYSDYDSVTVKLPSPGSSCRLVFSDGAIWQLPNAGTQGPPQYVSGNRVPTGTVTITGDAITGQTLSASNDLADADGMGQIHYQWENNYSDDPGGTFSNWNPIVGATQRTFTLPQDLKGYRVRVRASYTDGGGTHESVLSQPQIVVSPWVNHPPTGSVTISGLAASNEILTASHTLRDEDGLPPPVHYQWQSTSDYGATWTPIPNATESTFKIPLALTDTAVRVQAFYTDDHGTYESVNSLPTKPIKALNHAPTGSVAISEFNPATRNFSVSNDLADADGMGNVSYQWQISSIIDPKWTNIVGANSGSFAPSSGELNKQIRVMANYTDASGNLETVFSKVVTEVSNYVVGTPAADRLQGSPGNDQIDGWTGADIMAGGMGDDTYVVDESGDIVKESKNAGTDSVKSYIDGYKLPTNVENLILMGDRPRGGIGNALDNILSGNSADNILSGGKGNDTLYGFDGNDTLSGDSGADSMVGALGNDTYVVDNPDDVVVEQAGEGIDTVQSSISYVLGANVENLTLTGGRAINGTGNELDNFIVDNGGKNTLTGGGGNDTLVSFKGSDTLIGGTGDDTYNLYDSKAKVVITENAREGIDTVQTNFDYVLGANLENLTLGTRAGRGTGNGLDNIIVGTNPKGVTLDGKGGNDILKGDVGADTLIGGKGNSILFGGAGKDTIKIANGDVNTHNVIDGGEGNDTLSNDYGNDIFIGGTGDDVITLGGASNVVAYNPGDGTDKVKNWWSGDTLSLGKGVKFNDLVMTIDWQRQVILSVSSPYGNSSKDKIVFTNGDWSGTSHLQIVDYDSVSEYDLSAIVRFVKKMAKATMTSGNYSIRFGQWASNYDPAFFTSRNVKYYDPVTNSVVSTNSVFLIPGFADNYQKWEFWDHITKPQDELQRDFPDQDFPNIFVSPYKNLSGSHLAAYGGNVVYMYSEKSPYHSEWLVGSDLTGAIGAAQGVLNDASFGSQVQKITVPLSNSFRWDEMNVFFDPLVLDLNGNGVETTAINLASPILFDHGGTGTKTFTGWIAPTDGLLVMDRNGNDVIDNGSELFSENTSLLTGGKAANGFAALAQEDTNMDGAVDQKDANFGRLRVWQDANQDGISQANELKPLADLGIASINLGYIPNGVELPDDNWLSAQGSFVFGDGRVGTISDILLATANANPTPNDKAPVSRANVTDQSVAEGGYFSFQVPPGSFTDPDANDTLSFSATLSDGGDLPSWLNFDPNTQTFAGVPGSIDIGSYNVTVAATDSFGLSATSTFKLTVDAPDRAPVAGTIADQSANQNERYTFILPSEAFSDPDASDHLTYRVNQQDGSALPGWLQFDAASNTLSGTPASSDIGRLDLVVTATDDRGLTATTSFALNVGALRASEHQPFSFVVPADAFQNGRFPEGDTLAHSATLADGTALPSWLAFDPATRTFSGTPGNGDVGSLVLMVTATGSSGASASSNIALNVVNVIAPPTAFPDAVTSKADGGVVVVSAADLLANDTVPDSIHGDSLRIVGVSNATSGAGVSVVDGDVQYDMGDHFKSLGGGQQYVDKFSYTVTNTSGATSTSQVEMTIVGVNDAPDSNIELEDQAASQGSAFRYQLPLDAFTDADAGDRLTYTATLAGGNPLPQWLIFDAGALTFSGTPGEADVGSLNLVVTATDSGGLSTSSEFALDIAYLNHAPANAIPLNAQNAVEGAAFVYSIPANAFSDVDARFGDTLAYSASLADGNDLPGWLSFDASTQTFSGTPGAGDIGNLSVQVVATDNGDLSVRSTFTVAVTNPVFTGTDGNDHLVGMAYDSTLYGLAGDDTLESGAGVDTMVGGTGNDTYVVNNSGDVVIESPNQYDANGMSMDIDTVLASVSYTLSGNVERLTLTGEESINGTGNAFGNTLVGNSGDNILDGGAGMDSMYGGLGNDTYVVDNPEEFVVENPGAGIDTVRSSISYILTNDVENLELTGVTAINGSGNALDNTITGNAADNILDGGGGADTLIGGLGNDTYVVDNAGDVVVENAGEGTDTVQSAVGYALGGNVENLTLTGNRAINGTGNALDNVLMGNTGYNILTGGAGNDTLDGGIGTDTLIGGSGNDTYVVHFGDVVTELAGEGTDTVQSSISYILGANVENLVLTGTAVGVNGTGNGLDNVLDGTLSTAANTLTGGAGNDTYIVGTGDKVVEAAGEGTDTVQTALASYTLGANVENLVLTGTADSNGTGNELGNALTGNTGNNTLDGGAGADTMAGGRGDDTYVVDNANDVVIENEGEGTDTVRSSIAYTLGANIENLTLTGSAAINGTGNALPNTLTGNTANNVLDGGAGADSMAGGLGDDTYIVDNLADMVSESANAGTDLVLSSLSYTLGANVEKLTLTGATAINGTGNELGNVLRGNGADNILDGGAGADTLIGGAGNDTYVLDTAMLTDSDTGEPLPWTGDSVLENPNEGIDTVLSSVTYVLQANVENLTLTGTGSVDGTGNELNNVLLGNAANNRLAGGDGDDTLDGAGGDDQLIGGRGSDTYRFGRGSGVDNIYDDDSTVGNTDVLSFGRDIAFDQIWLRHVGNDLEVSIIGTLDKAVIAGWYVSNNRHIEQLKTSDGKVLLDSQVDSLVQAMAGFAPPAAGQTTLSQNYRDALTPALGNWT
jgi:Ca2+-binding RTX toxin-like protein/subtilisin-like proprotein convertase family protein